MSGFLTLHRSWLHLIVLGLGAVLAVAMVGCDDDGPLEEVGESIDEAADEVGDALEDAGDEIEDLVEGGG